MNEALERLAGLIEAVPDFPEPGILFRDITPLLAAPEGLGLTTELLAARVEAVRPDGIVAIESRGFIFAAPVCAQLRIPLLLARKPGKLPRTVHEVRYDLEYGSDAVQMHADDLRRGGTYLLLDDLIATGGTARATVELVRAAGADVALALFVIELEGLAGRDALDVPVDALLAYR